MGLLSGVGKLLKGAVSKIAPKIPGIGTAVAVAGGLAGKVLRRGAKGTIAAAKANPVGTMAAAAGVGALGVAALGGFGGDGGRRTYRRMNPGNTRALRRAFRRVEAGGRLFGKYYAVKHGGIKGARGVRAKMRALRARRRAA